MAQLDLKKKLSSRKGKKAPKFMYRILDQFAAKPQIKTMEFSVIDNVGVKNIKGPFILVSNHTSRCDWRYIGRAMYPHVMNFMASDIEFHRAHMHWIFDRMHLIPKKNFVPDFHTIKELKQVLADGGNVVFFPEGKSSISGTNQPIMMGTSSMLKHLGLPVYSTRITGGYMSNTQWNIAERPGKVIIEVNQLFTPDDLKELSLEEMDRRTNAAIYNDDFAWNKTARVKFAGNETVADKLEEHLYWCPKCGKELTMKGEGNRITCTDCGNGATINEYYDLIPFAKSCVIPKDMRVWYELQRRREYRAIRDNENFMIEENVILGALPNDHYVDKKFTSEPIGEGIIRLTRDEFSFIGTKNGEPFEIHNRTKAMATVILETDSSYFGAYFDGVYYEFQPEHPLTTKWLLSVEECHRLAGGQWQNILPQQQWIYEDDKDTDKENYFINTALKTEKV